MMGDAEWTPASFGEPFITVQRMKRNDLRAYARKLEHFAAERFESFQSSQRNLYAQLADNAKTLRAQDERISTVSEKLRKSERVRDGLIAALRDVTMNPKSDDSRASGRTTRLVLRGLIALSEGQNVYIVASTVAHARSLARHMTEEAARFSIKLNVPIRFGTIESERTGFRGVVLVDHSAIERMEAK